jgi:hypothetical protein
MAVANFATECDLTARVPAATGRAAAAVLAAAQASVIAFLNYDPRPVRATEWYDGTGTFFLALKRPTAADLIESVTEFTPWAAGDAGTVLTADADYVLRSPFVLERINRTWPTRYERPPGRLASNQETAKRAVSVDYTASGDAGLLGVCKEATLEIATTIWRVRPAGFGFQTSESVDGYSQSFTPFQLGGAVTPALVSPTAQLLLKPFRRPAIGGL